MLCEMERACLPIMNRTPPQKRQHDTNSKYMAVGDVGQTEENNNSKSRHEINLRRGTEYRVLSEVSPLVVLASPSIIGDTT